MAAHTSNGTTRDHQWYERREPHLKIESGEAVVQHHCDKCGRDIVTVSLIGRPAHCLYIRALLLPAR